MLTLYHAPTSVCSQKVRVGLAEMGLDYESILLDLQKGDQFDQNYLKLNPDAVVPTLVDDGLVIVESSLVLEYLDREYNDNRLMPKDRSAEAAARHWLLHCIAIHASINSMTFSTAMRRKFLAEKSPEEIAEILAKMPDPVMRMKRKDLFDRGLTSPFVGQALMYLRRMFEDMVAALRHGDWITGSEFGVADIALVAYVDRLEQLGFDGLWTADYPAVGRWLAAMRARPSYDVGIEAFMPPGAATMLRRGGAEDWPKLERIWKGN